MEVASATAVTATVSNSAFVLIWLVFVCFGVGARRARFLQWCRPRLKHLHPHPRDDLAG